MARELDFAQVSSRADQGGPAFLSHRRKVQKVGTGCGKWPPGETESLCDPPGFSTITIQAGVWALSGSLGKGVGDVSHLLQLSPEGWVAAALSWPPSPLSPLPGARYLGTMAQNQEPCSRLFLGTCCSHQPTGRLAGLHGHHGPVAPETGNEVRPRGLDGFRQGKWGVEMEGGQGLGNEAQEGSD